ncbi:neurofilament medium polypeptide-like [Helianthus annuus]|uniref:neurofilament medium polypeptide-like n=1 Tax=Helianthus annuus TaxID=4232 RepID=UPI000B8FF56E|nr:neurofilament medium polypeptide-like [Helianthus annuus]
MDLTAISVSHLFKTPATRERLLAFRRLDPAVRSFKANTQDSQEKFAEIEDYVGSVEELDKKYADLQQVAVLKDHKIADLEKALQDAKTQTTKVLINTDYEKHELMEGAKGKDWDKGQNVYCLLDATFTDKTVVEEIAKFLRESRIGKALTDKTIMYESHVRTFWNSARYEEADKMIHSTVRKKDEKGNDIDLEIKFGVEDLRRMLDLGDSDNDLTIIPERLIKGLWCRMGFTGHINGKMIKTMFSSAYRFMIHCVIHALSHRKGAYDEASDYIMNIITCLVLNRPYNVSQVIFEYMLENIRAGSNRYIIYPRFIMMMIDDQFKDIPKNNGDIVGLRNMTSQTITRLTKGTDESVKGMICKISNPAYVAPENDRWRHEKSDSDNEDGRMSEMVERKPDGGPSVEPQQRLVDETVIDPSSIPQESIDLAKVTLEQFIQLNEAAGATQKDQSSSVQAEVVKAAEPEGKVQDDSSEDDSEATESKSELDPLTLGRGKAQLKKKPTKKHKGSDEEDSTYVPPEKPKKQRAKRKVVQAGVIPRRVRARKGGDTLPKEKDGKKEKHVDTSKVAEAEKIQSVEILKEPEVQSVEVPEVKIQKKTVGDDYVEITGYKAATPPPPPPPPPPQDQPESS